jgi:ketosteroid isomerase-like protein
MKYRWKARLLVVLSLAGAIGSHAQQPKGESEKAVAARENQWLQSQKTNNPELLAPLLADGYMDTEMDREVKGKAQMLADAKATHYVSAEDANVKIAVFGDTVIVRGDFIGKGTDASGKAFEVHARWTDTWVKAGHGAWLCVATHASLAKKPNE